MVDIKQLCMNAKQASYELSGMPENKKNEILTAIAQSILDNKDYILAENKVDTDSLKGRDGAFLDRLSLNDARIKAMSDGLLEIVKLPDPVGIVAFSKTSFLSLSPPRGIITSIYSPCFNISFVRLLSVSFTN